MNQDEMTRLLEQMRSDLDELKKKVKAIKGEFTSRKAIREQSKALATTWFQAIRPNLPVYGIRDYDLQNYDLWFNDLLSLGTSRNSRTRSYITSIDEILRDYKNYFLIPIHRYFEPSELTNFASSLRKQFSMATEEEQKYLNEAFDCADIGSLRASIVLGWCAFVHRMHKVVEKKGFDEFSATTKEMKDKKGRYKWLTREYEVSTISELRSTVPDSVLMIVLEYWDYLESNQHDRMKRNYEMRNQAAHPGEAPITEENLLSFYSDLREIVYNNSKFDL